MDNRELAATRIRIAALEMLLSMAKIDNFNVGRRKLNARKKYLQTQYLGYANQEHLEVYENYLKEKFPKAETQDSLPSGL